MNGMIEHVELKYFINYEMLTIKIFSKALSCG